jgi:hypothetical protein
MMELSSFVASVTLDRSERLEIEANTYMSAFGFFFFFKMAVAVSSTCEC